MVVLILAFIFLVPASAFDDPEARSRRAGLGVVRERLVDVPIGGNSEAEASILQAIGDEPLGSANSTTTAAANSTNATK